MLKFEAFIEELTLLVQNNEVSEELVTKIECLLGRLISNKTWLPNEKCLGNKDHYARHSLYHDPNDQFEILALVWQPGQKTPIHDHDGTWGVEGVIKGRMKIKNYFQIEEVSQDVVRLCHTGTMTICEQSTGQLLPPADCHILEAEGEETAITIHIYGKQLRRFKIFEPLDKEDMYFVREHHV